jgi:CubicO group peptidase (beta-lactamase class C family)
MFVRCIFSLATFLAVAGSNAPAQEKPRERKTVVAIDGERFTINGKPTYQGRAWQGKKIEGLLFNSRMVQATFDDLNPETVKLWAYPDTKKWDADRNTTEFIAAMPAWRRHGLLGITLNLQGGSPQGYSAKQPWHNSALKDDGSLRPDYMTRLERVLDKADELGMVIILGLFYFGQDERLKDEAAIKRGVDNVVDWLFQKGYRNILIEVNNECNVRYDHDILKPKRVHELIERVQKRTRDGRRFLVGTSYGGGVIPAENVVRASDYLLLHGNGVGNPARIADMVKQTRKVAGYRPVPILFNEDDHFDFDKPANNFVAAVGEYASWGFFDFRMKGEGFDDGYQSVPVNWGAMSPRKKGFFTLLSEITNERRGARDEGRVFPGKTWATKTPQQAGLDAGKLQAFRDFLGGRGCVVRGGHLAFSWGDISKRGDIASAFKPWLVHLLLLLLEQGTIKSLDDPVADWEPRLNALNAKNRKITWRHLANQTSCYGVQEAPGAAYDYSDYNMALFFDTLMLKAHQSSYAKLDADILHAKLTDLLDCEDNPTFFAFGAKDRPGRLAVSVRDACRFGLLYLNEGEWNGKQLLSTKLARTAVTSPLPNTLPRTQGKKADMIAAQRSIGGGNNQTDHLGSYSFAWWTNGLDRAGKRHWPDAPLDTFGAFGHGGMRAIVVIPSLDLVVSWNDAKIDGRDKENRALKMLVDAVRTTS